MAEGINPRGTTQPTKSQRKNGSTVAVKDIPLEQLDATAITVRGRTFYVGVVSLDQLITIARLVLDAAMDMSESHRQALMKAVGTESANFEAALTLLDKSTVAKLFCVLLGVEGEEDETWLLKNLGALGALETLDAVMAHNDWKELSSAFFRLLARFKPLPA